jgi:ribosomal protein S18 acetylase RimI-like enzyme
MNWTVRKASLDDADRLALIGSATFLETFAGILDGSAIVAHCQREHSADAYRGFLGSGYQGWLAIVTPGDAPVGFALLGPADLPGAATDGSDLELKRIYVLSRFHGGGPGKTLMERAVEEAARQKARRVLLGVYKHNDRAIRFYRKNGFSQIAERRFRVGDRDYEDIVLAKALSAD